MSLGCKHDYIIQYNVALREPAIGAGMETPYIPRDQEDRGIWNFSKHCTLAGIRNHVNFHHAYLLEAGSPFRALSLSPPPPHLNHKKELNTNLRGKRLKQVVLFDFFFLSKEHYLFLSSVYLKTAISDLCKTNWCNLLGPPL